MAYNMKRVIKLFGVAPVTAGHPSLTARASADRDNQWAVKPKSFRNTYSHNLGRDRTGLARLRLHRRVPHPHDGLAADAVFPCQL
jgi:hypothetical protein